MVKHNNRLVKNHFKKDWERHVKTWFNQPGRKIRRRQKRLHKAAEIYPRPLHNLHPLVHGQTLKYQAKIRLGRGFTHSELKLAKINRRFARTIGITVDHRRRNRSFETRDANVQRLSLYMSKLILFPRKTGVPKKGDATATELETVVQQKKPFPFRTKNVHKERARAITEKEKTDSAYLTLRKARGEANKVGDKIRKERKEALGISAAAAKAEKGGKGGAKEDKGAAAVEEDAPEEEEGGKKAGGKAKGGKKK